MIILIPSVMHTGLHLLLDVFKHWKVIGPVLDGSQVMTPPQDEERYIIPVHLTKSNREIYRLVQDYPSVVPMRHPVKVLESFKRRGLTQEYFEEQWKCLIRIKDRLIRYVHVDQERRDQDLEIAGKLAGTRLSSDWPILTVKNTIDFEVTEDRVKSLPDWVMEHYKWTLQA